MNRIVNGQDDEKFDAEVRREVRKSLEKGMIENEPDKIQLNDIMLAALVIMAAAISFTDFTLSLGSLKNFTALTVFLYVVTTLVYRNRYSRGKQRGRNDAEYVEALTNYRIRLKGIYDNSFAALVPDFCKEYKMSELREYRENLLADIEMSYDEYKEKYWGIPDKKIMRLNYSLDIKRTLIKCNHAKPLRLVPGIILNENGETDREKLIGQSGRERERSDKKRQVISRGIMVIFGSAIAINIILDFSLLTIFQWFVRMIPIVFAMITGEDAGFCCVAVTETNFKRDQTSVINLFYEWEKKRKEKSSADEGSAEEKMLEGG